MPHGLVVRARMILACAEGLSNAAVAAKVGASPQAVGKWRRRFLERGVEGLHDELRPGRPRTYDDEKVAAVISRALQERPDEATQWSVRLMSAAEGVSKSTVQRWFSLFGVKPHLQETFKLSTDPFFIEKVRDIVGLYLNPPEHALVLCVDEKSQIQALERSQPTLPMGLGYVEGYTHDYVRHGTRASSRPWSASCWIGAAFAATPRRAWRSSSSSRAATIGAAPFSTGLPVAGRLRGRPGEGGSMSTPESAIHGARRRQWAPIRVLGADRHPNESHNGPLRLLRTVGGTLGCDHPIVLRGVHSIPRAQESPRPE